MATPSPPTAVEGGDGEREGDVPEEMLRACYEAFAARRLRRGAKSIRTRQGYERLRGKYQPRLRFLQEAAETLSAPPTSDQPVLSGDGGVVAAHNTEALDETARYSDEDDDDEEEKEKEVEPRPIVVPPELSADGREAFPSDESETSALTQLVGVFFDSRIKRFVLDTVWPLAHHGGSNADEEAKSKLRSVPEWQELEQFKYFAFMFKALAWLFPGLPAFEAQEVAEYDWKTDCEFDSYGSCGLSFEGFMVSILDLAMACTDSSVETCLEFLKHLVKRLETSLPIFRVPTSSVLPTATNEEAAGDTLRTNPYEHIVWRTIHLERLFPCPVRARPQFLELKTKLSLAPVVLMVLTGSERPIELQLSTSAKLLVRERDHRSSVRRNTMQSDALSHFIEIERQFLWTFRSFPARPTLVIVPSGLVSKRTLALYACCRLLESHEHTLNQESSTQFEPIMTLFTAVQEPFPMLFGGSNSLCGRVDRQSSRVFVVDHSGRESKSFKIIFKTSLIHNTSSAGGAGAAAVITSLAQVSSRGTARCKSELVGDANTTSSGNAPHSFIFVVKVTSDLLANGPQRRRASVVGAGKGTSKSTEANVPAQWFTTLCGANENKTIYVDESIDSENRLDGVESSSDLYYVYVFTLHGFYFEATCEDIEDATEAEPAQESNDESLLTAITHAEASKSRLGAQAAPGRAVYDQGGDEGELAALFQVQERSEQSGTPKASHPSMTTSTILLRQLLQLQKQRQHRISAQPPPEFVGGSKITNVRTLTSAAGLRAKFLKARAEERRARLLQSEEEFRSKVISRLMKVEAKRRALRGTNDEMDFPKKPDDSGSPADTILPADLEAKAALMMNFFKEMALYQPTQRELDDEEKAPLEHEELLESFADLFHDDHALHNILDEEKWMTPAEKNKLRQSLLDDRLRTRRQSLVVLNKQQVPQLDDEDVGMKEAQQPARKKSTTTRASEDYYSTAMLINQLMSEVAEEDKKLTKLELPERNEEQKPQDVERLHHLTASWSYAAHNSAGPASQLGIKPDSTHFGENQEEAVCTELEELEVVRREQWLSSHYVAISANNERLRRYHATLRPTIVPTRQDFEHQEDSLPWQPIWTIQTSTEASPLPLKCKSPRQRSRPMTANGAVLLPHPPSSYIGTDRSSAVTSATLSRHRTRRIRSAHSASSGGSRPPTASQTAGTDNEELEKRAQHQISYVPGVFLRGSYTTVIDDKHELDASICFPTDQPVQKEIEPSGEDISNKVGDCVSEKSVKSNGDDSRPTEMNQTTKKPKRRKAKKLTKEEKRFGGRVRELLSISPLIQSFAQSDSR